MTSNIWKRDYTSLEQFSQTKPGIIIAPDYICLPDEHRAEFYALFNKVREAVVREKHPDILDKSGVLSNKYKAVEQELQQFLGLSSIKMQYMLSVFLKNPVEALTSALFDPLFDLLKGKANENQFEETSSQGVEKLFLRFYQMGYEKWMILSLLFLLKPDKIFSVKETKAKAEESALLMVREVNEQSPNPKDTDVLEFYDDHPARLTVPDCIIHSTVLDKYVSFRSMVAKSMSLTSDKPGSRTWVPYVHLDTPWTGLSLVYLADALEEIVLIADKNEICAPDLIIACRTSPNWYEREGFTQIMAKHDRLNPRLGTHILSCDAIPEDDIKNQGKDIKVSKSDFNNTALEEVLVNIG
ncbi:MAG: hypothetical protein PHT28_04135 [Dehalococcoidales bacterium]|jgi:hypothetical protein|nr:hypothetical protein [Dehalococcoidales bacterium]MDD4230543.1 hypothetical protein [Dehalococcoidales bacterium]MDD5402630.1 hypothetical protein [Dehalococcoidales bacterium]